MNITKNKYWKITFDTNAHSNKITRKGQYTVKRVVILKTEINNVLMSQTVNEWSNYIVHRAMG